MRQRMEPPCTRPTISLSLNMPQSMLASQKSKEGSRVYGVELLGGYCGVHENLNMLSRFPPTELLRLPGL
jgi:hypothetical protein